MYILPSGMHLVSKPHQPKKSADPKYLRCENIILYLQELQNVVLQTAFHEVAAQDYLVASVDEEECGQIVDVVNA